MKPLPIAFQSQCFALDLIPVHYSLFHSLASSIASSQGTISSLAWKKRLDRF